MLEEKIKDFYHAINRKDMLQMSLLLHEGMDVNAELNGVTPLYMSLTQDLVAETQFLIDNGADVNRKIDSTDQTYIMIAIRGLRTNMLKLLLDNKADPNIKDYTGMTPLHLAILYDQPDHVELLIEYGADVRLTDDKGYTPIEMLKERYQDFERAQEILRLLEKENGIEYER